MRIEYTGEIAGEAWDQNTKYLLIIIITKWYGTREIEHRAYYFIYDYRNLSKFTRKEEWCKDLFENYRQNSRLYLN